MCATSSRAYVRVGVLTLIMLALAGSDPLGAQQSSPAPSAAQPTPPTDPFDRLQAALAAERDHRRADAQAKKKKEGRNAAEHNAEDFYKNKSESVQHVRNLPEAGKESAVTALVRDLRASARSDELRRVCDDLADQDDRRYLALVAAYVQGAEKVLRQTGDTVLRAREPKELDASIDEIVRLKWSAPTRDNSSDADTRRITNRLVAALALLHQWQDYLQALVRKDPEKAGYIMRSIASTTGDANETPLIPRSEILSRLPAEPEKRVPIAPNDADTRTANETRTAVLGILTATHTLDEIPAALGKLDELKNKPVRNPGYDAQRSGLDDAVAALKNLQATRQELQTGAEVSVSVPQVRTAEGGQAHGIEDETARLRADLLILALPRMLGAGDEKPVPGERLDACLQRLVESARKRGDWDAVLRGAELGRQLGAAPGAYTPADLGNEKEAFRQFRVGQTMEAAGQSQQAAAAYLLALKTGVQELPIGLIGERLSVIQKEHPQDYAAANASVLGQPVVAPKPVDTAPADGRTVFSMDPSGNLLRSTTTTYRLVVPARKAAGK